MGMFDKDKEVGLLLTSVVPMGKQFIVWNAGVTREDFPTKFGPSAQATLTISYPDNPGEKMDVTTLAGAIVDKVREAEDSDFPALVIWREAPAERSSTGKATVLQFLKAYGSAGVPDSEPVSTAGATQVPTDDDAAGLG